MSNITFAERKFWHQFAEAKRKVTLVPEHNANVTEHTEREGESSDSVLLRVYPSVDREGTRTATGRKRHITTPARQAIREKSRVKMRELRAARDQQFRDLVATMGEACEICGTTASGRTSKNGKVNRLHIDHDHETGDVRGLLCHHCNLGIGNLKDDLSLLRKAIDYLERYAANPTGVAYREGLIKSTSRRHKPLDTSVALPLPLEGVPVPSIDGFEEIQRSAVSEVQPRVHARHITPPNRR